MENASPLYWTSLASPQPLIEACLDQAELLSRASYLVSPLVADDEVQLSSPLFGSFRIPANCVGGRLPSPRNGFLEFVIVAGLAVRNPDMILVSGSDGRGVAPARLRSAFVQHAPRMAADTLARLCAVLGLTPAAESLRLFLKKTEQRFDKNCTTVPF